MKKQFLAVFLALAMLVSILPVSAMAEEGDEDGEALVVCAGYDADETCAAETHAEGCPLYVAPEGEPEDEPTVIGPEQEEPVDGPTVEGQLAELIAALPDPEDIDPMDEEQVKAIYDQIGEIYVFAGENGIDVEDNETINAVIKAMWPPEATDTVGSITEAGGNLANGTYELTEDINLNTNNLTIPTGNTVTIDLAGHTLKGNGNGSVITVNGTLTIKDSSTDGIGQITGGNSGEAEENYGGGIRVDGGTLTLQSGTICGNTSKDGGGVYITNNGTLTMTGGEISGNTCVILGSDSERPYGSGAGVYVSSGQFTMSGGAIKDNVFGSMGGGVFVLKGGSFEMTGGEISSNTAAQGGGVVLNGTFTMSGGRIARNTVTIPKSVKNVFSGTAIRGGGVLLTSQTATFNFNGGTISENEAISASNKDDTEVTAVAGGVYAASNADVLISGSPVVSDNKTDNTDVGNIWLGTGTVLTLSGDVTSGAKMPVTLESVSGKVTDCGSYTVASDTVTCESKELTATTRNGDVYFAKTVTEDEAVCSATVSGATVYYETLISALADLPTDDNEISILKNIEVDSTVTIPAGTAILTTDVANGITITWKGGAGNCFSIPSGAALTIKGNITVQPETGESGTPPKAAFSVSGFLNIGEESAESDEYPKITGFDVSTNANTSNNGAAVNVASGGTLNLYSGFLTGNKSNYGGSIYATGANASLNLYGGTVSGNTAVSSGGGVAVTSSAALTLAGTTISGNSAANGGGVYANNASVEMSAGTVGGASETDNNSNTATSGGGVYIENAGSVFHMTGGVIQYNKANNSNGGGVFVQSGTFELSEDGAIQNNTASKSGGGIYLNLNNAVLNIKGGTVSNNQANTNGGGIYANKGQVSITAGEIKSNTAIQGGGIYFAGDGGALTAQISGGSITNNEATSTDQYQGGGGIAVGNGTVTMTGGSISDNKSGKAGGGVFLATNAKFSIFGGSVTNNEVGANGLGAGICPWCATFNISGNPNISGNNIIKNSSQTASNVYLPDNKYITLSDALTSSASIGVTMKTTTKGTTVAQGVEGTDSYTVDEADALYFFYDGGSKLIQKADSDNKIVLADKDSDDYYTVTLTLPKDGSVKANRATTALVKSDGSYSVTLTADEGYAISSVKIGTSTYDASTGEYKLTQSITGNTTIEVTSTAKGIEVKPEKDSSVVDGTYGTKLKHKLEVSTAYTGEANSKIALTYALADGNSLPSGLTLSENGLISGMPTEVTTAEKEVTVVATANNGQTAEIKLTVTISKATPTVTLAGKTGVAYTGRPIELDSAEVTLVNGETYSGEVTYTYYSDEDCTNKLDSAPSAAGTYYVKASVAETDHYKDAESNAAKLKIVKATFTVSADGYSGVYNGAAHSITVHNDADTTVTYSTDGINYDGSNPAFVDTGKYTVYYKAVKANYEEYSSSATVEITQAEQSAPSAVPTCASRTTTSVTLTAVANNAETGAPAEYSKDGGATWQDSNVFTGLTANTKYTFAVRYKETTNYKASVSSTADIYTSSSNSSSSGSGSSGGSSSGSTTYTVTAPSSVKNGTVSVSTTRATKGTTVTITLRPNSGYELDDLTVTDKNGDAVKLTRKSDTKYTFLMPASRVTVSASFAEIEPEITVPAGVYIPVSVANLPFTDVPEYAWYANAVLYVCRNDLMNGVSTYRFAPEAVTSRGMIVTILYRLEGEPAVGASAFTDVAPGAWYARAAAWAAANGIVNGYGDGTFGPNDDITREQLAAILYRYAAYRSCDVSARTGLYGYADADQVSGYAADAMSWANAAGLITGVTADTLVPQGHATRAEVAVILTRFCENFVK